MTRILPPFAFVSLFLPLALLWMYHPEDLPMRADREMPWDVPLALGIAALLGARFQFVSADAEINTFKAPRNMVTHGLFGLSRNPMYLGFVLLLLAAAFYVNTWCALAVPLAFFLLANFWYIPHEEREMRKVFGDAYETYASRVRRWI